MTRLSWTSLAAAVWLLAGCGGANPGEGTAQARILNADPSLGRVDLYLDTARVGSDLPFTGQSGVTRFPAGTVNWTATRPNDTAPLATGTVRLVPGTVTTVLVRPGPSGPLATAVPDDRRLPPRGKFRIRFADLRSGAKPVDVYAIVPGVELPEVEILAQNLKPGSATPYVDVPEGEYQILVTQAGNPVDVVFERSDQSKGGKVFSVFLADPETPGAPLTFIQIGELP